MKSSFKGLILFTALGICTTVYAVPTALDCQNESTTQSMKLTIGPSTYTISANSTKSNISIPTTITSIKIRPSNTSYVGVPNYITISKAALNTANDNKYDITIQTTASGSRLTVYVYSLGELIASGNFNY